MVQERWTKGQEVIRPKVEPYKIVRLIGEAGNIHISEIGRYHVYWHRVLANGKSELVHHGGPQGFDDLKAVMHQHERVILRYTGMTIQLPLDQAGEIPVEEQKSGLPTSGQTFPELIHEMQIELPGEQKTLGKWIGILQDANRDLPLVRSHGKLSEIRENLGKVEKDLSRAVNPYKKRAAAVLETGLCGSQGELLAGLNDAQILLLQRAQQTVSIVVGTMRRYNDLEKLQIDWNRIVDGLPRAAAEVLFKLQHPSFIDDGSLERVVRRHILNETFGLEAHLDLLQGETYFSKARQLSRALHPLKGYWEQRDYQGILKVLASQAAELEIWKRRIKAESTGVDFGKYSLGKD